MNSLKKADSMYRLFLAPKYLLSISNQCISIDSTNSHLITVGCLLIPIPK
jgi:hypothetical protein